MLSMLFMEEVNWAHMIPGRLPYDFLLPVVFSREHHTNTHKRNVSPAGGDCGDYRDGGIAG